MRTDGLNDEFVAKKGRAMHHRLYTLLLLVTLATAIAGCSTEKFRSGNEVTIGSAETVAHDLYLAGGAIEVLGTVDGDLVAAGGVVDVIGDVEGDVLAAGGTIDVRGTVGGDLIASGGDVEISGEVRDDVRVAGGRIEISSRVKDNVIAAGGRITLSRAAVVSGDLVVGGGSVHVEGIVEGDALLGAEDATISGTVMGNVEMHGDRLVLKSTARIDGDLTYTSDREATIEAGAQVLGVTIRETPTVSIFWFIEAKSSGLTRAVRTVVQAVQWFLGTFIVSLLLVWLAPVTMRSARDTLAGSPWKSLGLGILVFFVTPIVVIIVAVIGISVGRFAAVPVAVVPAAAYVVLLLLASPLIALFAGQYSLERAAMREDPAAWQSIAVGAALLALIGLVPVLNVAVGVLVGLFGFGTWLLYGYRRYTAARAESRV